MIRPKRWLEQFAEYTDYDVAVQRKLLWENAEAFLGL
jgi:hypothetical protein